jgi:hypothetical protein
MRRFLGQQLGAFVYKDPPVQISYHELSRASATFWDVPSTDESITSFVVSGPSGSIPGTYTAGDSGPPYTSWNSGGDDLTLQSNGKWTFEDDGDVVWISVDTDKLYPWNVQAWEVGDDGSDGPSRAPVFSWTLSGMSIFSIKTETIFWGDGTSETFEDGNDLAHTWSPSTFTATQFTNGKITETSNHYMSKTFIRGSSKVLEKLI